MTIQSTKKRSDAIDMVKGLSIMTLFFLHFENGGLYIDYNIFLVRSPSFFIVIGWLWGLSSNRRTVKEHWTKRLQGLVKPYIYFSLIFLAYDLFLITLQVIEPHILYRDIYKTLCLRGIGTLWFLPALLCGEIIFLYLRTKKSYIKFLYTIIIFAILYMLRNGYENKLVDAPLKVITNACNAYIYISVAYFISKRWGKRIIAMGKSRLAITGTILLLCDFFLVNFIGNIGIFGLILGSTLAGFGILLLFTAIEDFKPIAKPLVYCGKNSLTIMAIHYSILFETARIVDKYILGYEHYHGSRTLIYFFIAVVLQVLIIEFINRKTPFIIGK